MEYEYRAVGEYLIVEKLPWLKTEIELPDSMKPDQGIVRGEILAIGNQEKFYSDFYEDYNDVEKGILNVNDIILYDSRVGLEINQDEKTGNYLIRFANILAVELDEEPIKIKKLSRSVKEIKKKKPRKKKKKGKKRTISS